MCIHDILGLQCIIGQFRMWSCICKFTDVRESFTAKQKDGLEQYDFFTYFECLEAKIFQYNFLQGHLLYLE